eukprot:gnl/MRDRNA2_/MRDRNA2_227014_c0_seq1.p1 gnl/MRDRNA2_/MRDRNA2_227014_c0~~gnl/MRDRNA2_/MRDRNA2_227014_c0_seq1.p1  ORF type:complete len:226 (-),score=19.99 gnl/MRDRNA2_/MRDRNA2_227014_c0_seq1:43-720(-)
MPLYTISAFAKGRLFPIEPLPEELSSHIQAADFENFLVRTNADLTAAHCKPRSCLTLGWFFTVCSFVWGAIDAVNENLRDMTKRVQNTLSGISPVALVCLLGTLGIFLGLVLRWRADVACLRSTAERCIQQEQNTPGTRWNTSWESSCCFKFGIQGMVLIIRIEYPLEHGLASGLEGTWTQEYETHSSRQHAQPSANGSSKSLAEQIQERKRALLGEEVSVARSQ